MSDSINQIIETYKGSIFKICLGYSKCTQDAEDLLQETMINVWKGLSTFKHEASLKTWVYRVTVNTCLLRLRKKSILTADIEGVREAHCLSNTSYFENDDQLAWLHQAIQELPEKNRIVILLYLEGLSHREIAEIIGLTANNVGARINRIKKHLKSRSK